MFNSKTIHTHGQILQTIKSSSLPPTIFAGDTISLSGIVDGVLLVARSGKTPKEMISEAVVRIGRDRILGVVFNEDGETNRAYQRYYACYQKKSNPVNPV